MMVFKFLNLAGPDRPAMIRAVLFKVIDSAFAAAPLGIAYLATAAAMGDPSARDLAPFPVDSLHGVLAVAGALFVCHAVQWLFFLLSSNDGYGASYRMTSRLRTQLADHLRKLPMAYFQKMEPGRLGHIVMQDVLAIEQVAGLVLPRLVSAVTLAGVALIASFALDWRMGLAISIGLPLAIPALILGHRALRNAIDEDLHGRAVEIRRRHAADADIGIGSAAPRPDFEPWKHLFQILDFCNPRNFQFLGGTHRHSAIHLVHGLFALVGGDRDSLQHRRFLCMDGWCEEQGQKDYGRAIQRSATSNRHSRPPP
jgi:hypothetical protein